MDLCGIAALKLSYEALKKNNVLQTGLRFIFAQADLKHKLLTKKKAQRF